MLWSQGPDSQGASGGRGFCEAVVHLGSPGQGEGSDRAPGVPGAGKTPHCRPSAGRSQTAVGLSRILEKGRVDLDERARV